MDKSPKTSSHYLLILCGGSGPRLWPLSRSGYPKQFLKILSNNSLLQETVNRSLKILPASNIFLISNQKYLDEIKDQIKNILPTRNIITEPLKRNTAMAILYGCAVIKKINPNAIITSCPADHFIKNINLFKKDILQAVSLSKKHKSIVLMGVKPTFPSSSYGYIVTSKKTDNYFQVKKFIEKPEKKEAEKLLKTNCFWNTGIYTFSIEIILNEFKQIQPEYFTIFQKIENNLHNCKKIKNLFQIAPNLPIDMAISQYSKKLITIPVGFYWNDVGEWKSIYTESKKDKNNNATINSTQLIQFQSEKCLISAPKKKLVGLVGINNLAIIDTPDALLICNLAHGFSYNVRDLVNQIVADKKTKKYFVSPNDQ